MITHEDILKYIDPQEQFPYARVLRRCDANLWELQHFATPEDAALRNNPRTYPHYVTWGFLTEYFYNIGSSKDYTNGPVPEDYNKLTINAREISNYPGIVFRFPWEVDGKEADPETYGYVYLTADPRKHTHVIAYTLSKHGWHVRSKLNTEAVCNNFIGEQVYSWPSMPEGIHNLVMGDSDV